MSIRHGTKLHLFGACIVVAFTLSVPIVKGNGVVAQSLNESLTPGPFYWGEASGKIGWYWTAPAGVKLVGVQTRLRTGFENLNNNYTFTTTIYTDRPAIGGTPLSSFTWNGATNVIGNWQGGSFPAPVELNCGTRYFIGMSGWEQGLAQFEGAGGSGVNWINPPTQPGAETLGAGSGYTGANYEAQMNTGEEPANVDCPIIRFLVEPIGYVAQDLNENLIPGPFYWAPPQIGWYWTPANSIKLIGIQTQLRDGFPNISNDFVFTTTLWTDRPAVGGTPIASFQWHGGEPVEGPWVGGQFNAPISLTGGTQYFVGMTGWEQGFAFFNGNGGSGINWIHPPTQAGAENLGAGSGYVGTNFETKMNTGATPANVDSPVIRFIAVLDADGDGVADADDACPNTPTYQDVDEDGRPKRDTNNDCVVNAADVPVILNELLGIVAPALDCAGNPLRDANGDLLLNGADIHYITREIVGL